MPALCTGSSQGSLRKEDRTGYGLERFLNAAPTPAFRQRPSDARSISQDKSSVRREGVRAEPTACKRGMITDERASARVNPPPRPPPPPASHGRLSFVFALITFHIEQLSQMINHGTVTQCSRTWAASVPSRSICDLKSQETPAGGRGGGSSSVRPLLSFPSRLRSSAAQTPLRGGRRRGPSAGTSDCFPSEEPL